MTSWKSSVARLTAFFEKETQVGNLREIHSGNEGEMVESLAVEAGAGRGTAPLDSNNAAHFQAMVHDVWGDLLRHARDSQGSAMDQVFAAAGEKLSKKKLTNVAEEVYKRELIAVLETISSHAKKSAGEDCSFGEEDTAVNSLKRRLKDMSKETKKTQEALQFASKEKCELEYMCEEHEEKRKKLLRLWKESEAEKEELRSINATLMKQAKKRDAEIEKLEAEKSSTEVKKLQALHKAEMAELVARQSSLHCRRMDEQIKSMEHSSSLVHKHVEELERALEEVTSVLNNAVNSPIPPRARWLEGQVGLLVRKSSQVLRRFRGSRSRDENADESRRDQVGTNEEGTGRNGSVDREEPPSLTIEKRSSLGFFLSSNRRQRDANQPSLFRTLTSRLRRVGSERDNGMEAQDGGAGIENNSGSHGLSGRRSFADGDHNPDGSRSGNSKMAGFRRMLSRGARRDPGSQFRAQTSDPEAVEYMSKTLEQLEKNLESLKDVYEFKDEEVVRLHGELRNAIKLSDKFEQGMKSELHKRLEVEKALAATSGGDTMKKSEAFKRSVGKFDERANSVRDKVTVRYSCRWF